MLCFYCIKYANIIYNLIYYFLFIKVAVALRNLHTIYLKLTQYIVVFILSPTATKMFILITVFIFN